MKTFSKILALVLAGLMAAAIVAGCSPANKDWEDIGPKGKMIIGITDFPPMNYKDESGKWTGFETEFAEAVCAILGVTPEFVEIDWGSKETELKAKNIDCVWNGMTVTDERAKNMDFSVHYMKNRQVLVTLAANEDKYQSAADLEGARVVAEKGSTGEKAVAGEKGAPGDEFFAKADYTGVEKQITALMEVVSGTADLAVVDFLIAANILSEGGNFASLVISKHKTFGDEEYAIAFRKNSPETLKKVNDAIKELKDSGEFQAIGDKYGLGDLLIK